MKKLLFSLIALHLPAWLFAQSQGYIDGRPAATLRMDFKDAGIVMHYGDGPDSCDTYGAREAVVNKEGDTYYLFYDGAGSKGWISCLAESKDLTSWTKKGTVLTLGDSTKNDFKSASSPWVVKEKDTWHMFYIGTPNTTPPPYRIPAFPYLTMKAQAKSLRGPWIKQYDVTPLPPKGNSYYTVTSSPGFIVKNKGEYIQFFSGATQDDKVIRRTLGIARTKDLNASWKIEEKPIFLLTEQVENSSVYYEEETKTWFLFTNHIGINDKKEEYTDAIWVYWTRDINHWDASQKAIALDSQNSVWAHGAIGMPSVIRVGKKLALLYDAVEGSSTSHMQRSIGLAWIGLPLRIPQ
ncbi:hypothetical protein [Dyadobacter arcticus]|uniref:GH43/DUF377 family glycosyl hydrolase n=1 Tax=Dyadobacter arcticus TaxID=1078754 RepID=A0ABX0UES4_9BACT|nr:hypothetical protein [Dyadobacter arcticus]NIJ51491.1 putative GH43/DUF377 family glycosyl hydrolase [Dyadobacter arcticus]